MSDNDQAEIFAKERTKLRMALLEYVGKLAAAEERIVGLVEALKQICTEKDLKPAKYVKEVAREALAKYEETK